MSVAAARTLPLRLPTADASMAGRALLAVTGVLVGFGLLAVYSASSYVAQARGLPDTHYLLQQLSRAGVGMALLVVASQVDYHVYRCIAWPIIGLTVLLLGLLLVPGTEAIAPRLNGARRWLRLGLTFQPSELAKLAVVVWTATLAVRKQDRLRSFRAGLLPILIVDGLICLLILAEPHFSAAVMVAAVTAIILFSAGARVGHFAFLGILGLPILWSQLMSASYRASRVFAFLNPDPAAAHAGYQLRQSLIAVGSGGWHGVGYGQSLAKLGYLPEPQNDFIFSIIAEEWGLVGSVALVGLLLGWALLGLRIAGSAPDLLGRLLATGFAALVFIAAFAHIGVAIGLFPTTGVNLPFISAGGTNLVLMLGATGVLLNVSKRRRC
ncbi:MAG: FtsW/RodA/SpoVE family cell cycle protein [Gemmatimonadota bacterium]